MSRQPPLCMLLPLSLGLFLLWDVAQAGGIRDHTRSTQPRDTVVSDFQAQILSLSLADVAVHQLQSWVRTAGQIDDSGKTLQATSCFADAALVAVGQRVLAFTAEEKSAVSQAWITRVDSAAACVRIEATLAAASGESGRLYVMEIVIPRGRFLAIPKEAIIEEEGRSLVYIQSLTRRYLPRTIHTGLQGERYTQVLHGLQAGERVVTLGSFFIHAQQRLDENQTHGSSDVHHVH